MSTMMADLSSTIPGWTLIHFWADQNWTRDILWKCFWYISIWYLFTIFHTHFLQFKYIIIWYLRPIYLLVSVLIHFWVYQSVFDTLLSVSKLYQKWIKRRCPILIGSKVYQSSASDNCHNIAVNHNDHLLSTMMTSINHDDPRSCQPGWSLCQPTGLSSSIHARFISSIHWTQISAQEVDRSCVSHDDQCHPSTTMTMVMPTMIIVCQSWWAVCRQPWWHYNAVNHDEDFPVNHDVRQLCHKLCWPQSCHSVRMITKSTMMTNVINLDDP